MSITVQETLRTTWVIEVQWSAAQTGKIRGKPLTPAFGSNKPQKPSAGKCHSAIVRSVRCRKSFTTLLMHPRTQYVVQRIGNFYVFFVISSCFSQNFRCSGEGLADSMKLSRSKLNKLNLCASLRSAPSAVWVCKRKQQRCSSGKELTARNVVDYLQIY